LKKLPMERKVASANTITNKPSETVTALRKIVVKTRNRKKQPMIPGWIPKIENIREGSISEKTPVAMGRRAPIAGGIITPRPNIDMEVAITKVRQSLAEK